MSRHQYTLSQQSLEAGWLWMKEVAGKMQPLLLLSAVSDLIENTQENRKSWRDREFSVRNIKYEISVTDSAQRS